MISWYSCAASLYILYTHD